MEHATHQLSSEAASLLMLNDYCLDEVFKLLDPNDFVNVAVTCRRLFEISQQCKKFKNIQIIVGNVWLLNMRRDAKETSHTVQKFARILSVIGPNVVSLLYDFTAFDILRTIADKYTNTGIAELDSYYAVQLDGQLDNSKSLSGTLPFRNLTKLTVGAYAKLSTDDWSRCFANNPGIEHLEYTDWGHNKCLPLLPMLPKLTSLRINRLKLIQREFRQLACLTTLTKLSLWSERTYNKLLIRLAKKLNLKELDITMTYDADTYAIVKSFAQLEVLSMFKLNRQFNQFPRFPTFYRVPETTIFPHMIKKIKLGIFEMSCTVFLSIIVKRLTLLEEFHILYNGQIFWVNADVERFPNSPYQPGDIERSRIIHRIAKELRAEKRKLKIIFYDDGSKGEQVWKYSDNLVIIMLLDTLVRLPITPSCCTHVLLNQLA